MKLSVYMSRFCIIKKLGQYCFIADNKITESNQGILSQLFFVLLITTNTVAKLRVHFHKRNLTVGVWILNWINLTNNIRFIQKHLWFLISMITNIFNKLPLQPRDFRWDKNYLKTVYCKVSIHNTLTWEVASFRKWSE